MGSSSKRKKEKKQDFQKPKLKVGKNKPKASNFTDTSFKARSIVLNKQSISVAAPSAEAHFLHQVSLLHHKSDSQRHDSLANITNTISTLPHGAALPIPAAVLIPKVQSLMLDSSNSVRQQVLKFFNCLAPVIVRAHVDKLLLYTRAAMTHLSMDIRTFSVEVLEWLLRIVPFETVACSGGWTKTLRCFLGLLGWQDLSSQNGWSSIQVTKSNTGNAAKVMARKIYVLAHLLRVGLGAAIEKNDDSFDVRGSAANFFPLTHYAQHRIPQRSNAFGHLNLFGNPPDEDNEALEEREDRQRMFLKHFNELIMTGIDIIKQEGGELGREASNVRKAIIQGMEGYMDSSLPK